jgi:hypothetical protein
MSLQPTEIGGNHDTDNERGNGRRWFQENWQGLMKATHSIQTVPIGFEPHTIKRPSMKNIEHKLRQETRDWSFSMVSYGVQRPQMTFDRSIPTASDASTKSTFFQLHLTLHSDGSRSLHSHGYAHLEDHPSIPPVG